MTERELERAIDCQIKMVNQARDFRNLEPDRMFDFVRFGSWKLYRPTLAHVWFFMTLENFGLPVGSAVMPSDRSDPSDLSDSGKPECSIRSTFGYALTFSAHDVRNILYREIMVDIAAYRKKAKTFFAGYPELVPIADVLLDDLKSDSSDGDDSRLDSDWYAAIVVRFAKNFHWDEEKILSMPMVRLTAYGRMLSEHPVRKFPALPEEKILQDMMVMRRTMSLKKQGL